jgi:hypothetical protein
MIGRCFSSSDGMERRPLEHGASATGNSSLEAAWLVKSAVCVPRFTARHLIRRDVHMILFACEAVEHMLEPKLERNVVSHERACPAMSIWKHRPKCVFPVERKVLANEDSQADGG